MFLSTGERWKNRRRLLTPAFHFQILNSFVNIFNELSIICAQDIEALIESDCGKTTSIDIFSHMARCALDIISGNK